MIEQYLNNESEYVTYTTKLLQPESHVRQRSRINILGTLPLFGHFWANFGCFSDPSHTILMDVIAHTGT